MINKIDVLFIWEVNQELQDYLKKGISNKNNVNLIFPENLSDDYLVNYGKSARIIVGWRPSAKLLNKAKKLKVFINPGAGVQHHIQTFRELNKTREIILINGHGNAYFTAQHGVALLLSLTNKVIPHHVWMQEGKWRLGDKEARSIPLRDRKIGLLGYGNVNKQIHKMLKGFTNNISIKRNHVNSEQTDCMEFSDLNEFLYNIDTLICCVPSTTNTKDLITSAELDILGNNAIVVNLSRGDVFNEKDLFQALDNKKILGAAIDVWYNYRPHADEKGRKFPYHYPFYKLDNVVLSPHRAASPFNDLKRWDEVIENICKYADGDSNLLNIVNLDDEY